MESGKRISRIMIGIVTCILVIYTCLHLPVRVKREERNQDKMNRMLLKQSQKMYLPGFTYLEVGEDGSLEDWVVHRAMEMIPVGTYMEERAASHTDVEDMETYQMILASQANDENMVDENGNLVQEDGQEEEVIQTSGTQIDTSMEKLMDYEYLLGNFYAVDSNTMADPESTILGMGAYLSELLNDTYGIPTIHHEGVYDLVDGKLDRSMAYELAEPEIQKILSENPSIEVVIDLHRDGVGEGTHLVTEVNGKPTAQIMFFNGLSRTRANGNISYLANPYIEDNLAFSLQMQIAAVNKYPGFTRHIYLRGYRYNMHVKPKTLLIEAGAQTNTVEEMRNAMEALADTLHTVLGNGS